MNKLRMQLETLAVQSFETSAAREAATPITQLPCSAIDACPSALACPTTDPATSV